MTPSGPSSPCRKVCVLDAHGVCAGCGRTLEEIARWSAMSAAQQWAVIARLERLQPASGEPAVAPAVGRGD